MTPVSLSIQFIKENIKQCNFVLIIISLTWYNNSTISLIEEVFITVLMLKKSYLRNTNMTISSRSDSYIVLSPLLSKLGYAYRRNCKKTFYHLVYLKIESEIAAKSNKQYLFVLYPKIHFLLVLQCSKSIIHQPKWCICQ